jgi:hypothetical protein
MGSSSASLSTRLWFLKHLGERTEDSFYPSVRPTPFPYSQVLGLPQAKIPAVLDAFVGICLCHPTKQRLALCVDVKASGTTMYVAEQNSVTPQITPYLESVWDLLRQLSTSSRHAFASQCSSPAALRLQEDARKLRSFIYRFMFDRIRHRIVKRSHELAEVREWLPNHPDKKWERKDEHRTM